MMISTRHIVCGLLLLCNANLLRAAKNPTRTSLYGLGNILKKNEKKPLTIVKAVYGTGADKQSVDVTALLARKAVQGVLYIPQNMKTAFKVDPAPEKAKNLDIIFATADQKTYAITVDEAWQVPAWYNFAHDETAQVMVVRDPYLQAKKCSLDDLMVILEANNKKPFKVINGQYGKLNTQKTVDITRNLDLYARTGIFMLPENGVDFCQKDPAPEADKKIQIIFEITDQWYQVQVSDQWTVPNTRALEERVMTDDNIKARRNLLVTRAVTHNITFLKAFQPGHMNRLKNILQNNNNVPFVIVNAFVTQPYFETMIQYDITAALQVQADAGLLCLPQNLRAFIGDQGTLPYMYVAKILFIMNGTTYNLCYRNAFLSVPAQQHQTQFDNMMDDIAPYICFP